MPSLTRHISRPPTREGQDGQALVVFALALMVMVAGVGLVIDGGAAYAQRRVEQGVADLASMAGATAYLNTSGGATTKTNAAISAAQSVASTNGYTTDAPGGVAVVVSVVPETPQAEYATVTVTITAPHRNWFAGAVGQPVWNVTTTATAISTGEPNAAYGAMPVIFNKKAFPLKICPDADLDGIQDGTNNPCTDEVFNEPGNGNQDVPQDETQFNWTVYCLANGNPCNANSNVVRNLINQNGYSTVVDLGMLIGPLNAGSHTALFNDLSQWIGDAFPVAIVEDDGSMVGWAMFKLTDVQGSSEKVIRGYFAAPLNNEALTIVPGGGSSSVDTGQYVIKLVN